MFNIRTAKTIGMSASRAQCKSPARSGMLHTHQIECTSISNECGKMSTHIKKIRKQVIKYV